MSTLLQTVTLLLALGVALTAQGSPLGGLSSRQIEAFHLHHRAALRGLAAVNKVNELRAAASAKQTVSVPAPDSVMPAPAPAPAPAPEPAPAPAPAPAAAPAPSPAAAPAPAPAPAPSAAVPSPDIWRQFVLDRLSAEIDRHQVSQPATLPAVTLTQKTLTRLLAEGRMKDAEQSSSAWHRAAALQLRAAMDADHRLVLAKQQPGGKGPTSAMAEAIAELSAAKPKPVPADTQVSPLTKKELRYIRELLEEALEGDIILPQ